MATLQKKKKQLQQAVRLWVPTRERTVNSIQTTIDKLKHRRSADISRITGSTASIGGSVLAFVGLALAPFTFGTSLVLVISGVAATVLGGTTVTGASIADLAIQRSNVKEAQEHLDYDYRELRTIIELVEEMREMLNTVEQKCSSIDKLTVAVIITEVFTEGATRLGKIGIKAPELAVEGGEQEGAPNGVTIAGLVLNIAMIPIDIAEIIRSSYNTTRGRESNAVKKMEQTIIDLEEQKHQVQEFARIEKLLEKIHLAKSTIVT